MRFAYNAQHRSFTAALDPDEIHALRVATGWMNYNTLATETGTDRQAIRRFLSSSPFTLHCFARFCWRLGLTVKLDITPGERTQLIFDKHRANVNARFRHIGPLKPMNKRKPTPKRPVATNVMKIALERLKRGVDPTAEFKGANLDGEFTDDDD